MADLTRSSIATDVALFIGPEGGFDNEETKYAGTWNNRDLHGA